MIDARTHDAIRKLYCAHCHWHFTVRGVPCLKHTLPSERAERAKAIGAVR